jgi:3D (Asp-Asp-Asp) domain-containing protein
VQPLAAGRQSTKCSIVNNCVKCCAFIPPSLTHYRHESCHSRSRMLDRRRNFISISPPESRLGNWLTTLDWIDVGLRDRVLGNGRIVGPLAAVCACILLAAGCASRTTPPRQPTNPTQTFSATAYCHGSITASGTRVGDGVVAADPAVLPLGTTIRVSGLERRYNRVYRVLDTGRSVRGREIDVYMRDCREAVRFGRRQAVVSVVQTQ